MFSQTSLPSALNQLTLKHTVQFESKLYEQATALGRYEKNALSEECFQTWKGNSLFSPINKRH